MFNNSAPNIPRIAPGLDRLLYGGAPRELTVAIMDGLGPQQGINSRYAFVAGASVESLLTKLLAGTGLALSASAEAAVMKPEERDKGVYDRESTVRQRYEAIICKRHPQLSPGAVCSIDRREWYTLASRADFVLGTDDPAPYANIYVKVAAGGQKQIPSVLPPALIEAMLYAGHGNRVAIVGGRSQVRRNLDQWKEQLSTRIIEATGSTSELTKAVSVVWDPDTEYAHASTAAPAPLSSVAGSQPVLSGNWSALNCAEISQKAFEDELKAWWTAAVVVCSDESSGQILLTNGVSRPNVLV